MSEAATAWKTRAKTRGNGDFRATVRAGIFSGLEDLLRSLGCDPGQVFARIGMERSALADPDQPIDYQLASQLLAQSAATSGCPHLGLLLGQEIAAPQLGFSGFMVRAAANVGQALQTLADYLDLHDTGGHVTFEMDADSVRIGYLIHAPGVPAPEQGYDLSAAVLCRLLRDFLGRDWNPTEVRLTRGSEVDAAPYQRFFRSPLVFGCEACVVVFPSRHLGHELTSADAQLYHRMELEAALRHGRDRSRLIGALPGLLRHGLLINRYSAREVAAMLGLRERSLHRHLQAAGTTYRSELDRVRFTVSIELLSGTFLRVSDIAQSVGYADSTTFIRAFRRWSGNSPLAWRKRHFRGGRRTASRPLAAQGS